MQNIDATAKREIQELAKEFGLENIENLLKSLSSYNVNKTLSKSDAVFAQILKVLNNKYEEKYQTYNISKSYRQQIIEEIENFIIESCEQTTSIIQDINALSGKTYESDLCKGSLALDFFSQSEHFLIKFEDDKYYTSVNFDKKGLSYLRKLLQIAQEDLCLVLKRTEEQWIPIGYILKSESILPTFTITGPLSWEFTVANETVTFSGGKYVVKKEETDELSTEIANTLFCNLKEIPKDTIKNLIESIRQDKSIHGALIVFVDNEHKPIIDGLCQHKRGIKISNTATCTLKNNDFLKKILLHICRIDGAVVFDKNGQLLSIGTILDGRVIRDGDVGRGSRYNSTKTFVEFYSQPQIEWAKGTVNDNDNLSCIGLVISEDNYIDLIFKDQIFGGIL